MIYETYKESGKVPVPGLILYIVLGLFGSYLILSAYCQFICSFPAVLFRLAGMAVSLFLICLWLVFLCGLAKIRRSRLVRILTLVMLLAAYYASRGVYITLVKDLWQYGSNEVYKQASASDSFRAAIRLWFVRPISLWIHPYQILKGLYEILPIGVGDSGRKTLHGIWLLIFWLLEFQLLMTLPPYLAQKRSQRPFDEINKTWNPSPETWTVSYVEDYRRIITALRRKEPKPLVEALQEMKAYKVEGEESFALISFSHFSNIFSAVLIVILSVVSLFIVYNTIKLTCFARRKEIRVMRYVGATDWYIRAPFILEGAFLGALGAVIALAIIGFGYTGISNYIMHAVSMPMDAGVVSFSSMFAPLLAFCLVYGIAIGSLGSVFSMRKYLEA